MSEIVKEKIIRVCDQAVQWLLLLAVFLLPLSFAMFYEVNDVFVLYKAAVLRIFIISAAFFYLARVLAAGKINYRFSPYFFWSVLFLALSGLLAVIFSDYPVLSFWGSYGRLQGFLDFFFYLLFFSLLILTLRDFLQVRRLIAALLFSSFFVCLYGVAQVFSLDPISWSEPFSLTGRIFSTLGQPNFLGQFLVLVLPLCIFSLIFLTKRLIIRLLLAVLLFGQAFCLYFTMSRAAVLAVVAEIIALTLISLILSGRKKLAIILLVLALFGAGAAGVGLLKGSFSRPELASLAGHAEGRLNFKGGSGGARLNYWRAAGEEIKSEKLRQKLFGHGQDTLFEIFARRYQPDWALFERPNVWADRAHNLFLDIILSTGLFGLAAYIFLITITAGVSWRFFKTAPIDARYWLAIFCSVALLGYFVNNLFSFSEHSGYLLFYFILGVLVFLISAAKSERTISFNLSMISRAAIFASVFIFSATILFYYGFRPVLADYYYARAVKNNYFDCELMLEDSKRAILIGGGNSSFYGEKYFTPGFRCLSVIFSEESDKLKGNLVWLLDFLPGENRFNLEKRKAEAKGQIAELFDKSYYQRAENDFSVLARKYPSISRVFMSWAEMERGRGNYEAEIDIAGRGLEVLPLKNLERASLQRRADINSLAADFYEIICDGYAGLKQNEKLLECYDKLMSFDSRRFGVYKKIADIYYQKGDFEMALWYNKKGYNSNPGDYSWPLAIGLLYLEKGDEAAADDYFKKVLELSPGNAEALKLLGAADASAER